MLSVLTAITLVLTLAFALSAAMRRASAASRHVVWTCALAAVLLIAPLRWRMPQHVYTPSLPAVATAPIFVNSMPEQSGIEPAQILAVLWALGALVLLIRLARNAFQLRSIVGASEGESPIRSTASIRGPLVTGILRPVILLPAESSSWNAGRRRAVIAHEAAHIRRRDPLILFIAQLSAAIYWFHPLVWLAASRLRAESESACDNAALNLGILPSGYAGHLLDLARKFDAQLAIPMATTSHLESRMKSILDPKTNRSAASHRTWFGALGTTALMLFALSTVTLSAQSSGSASIAGAVIDPSGAVVPSATVKAVNADLNTTDTAYSESDGTFSFANLAPGHYTVSVMEPGFAVFKAENLDIAAGETAQVRARLAVGKINESIEVAAQGQPKPDAAAPSRRPERIRVGGNIQAAALIRQVRPSYPPDLKAAGVQGTVSLQAIVAKDGSIQSLSSISGSIDRGLVTAAMDAVSQWRYRPTLLNGEPIEVMTTIDVHFTLAP
ncbi:MAG: TonB family protein [Acidobacteriota bacterium]|nr:TonB family protein [Acidobacteriota bacterium]